MSSLYRLYKSLGDYDTLRGIFSSQVGVKSITQEALAAEERADYIEALRLYKEAVGCDNWSDGEPSQVEEDLWYDSMLKVSVEYIHVEYIHIHIFNCMPHSILVCCCLSSYVTLLSLLVLSIYAVLQSSD